MSKRLVAARCLKDVLGEVLENTLLLKNDVWSLYSLGLDVEAEFDQVDGLRHNLRMKIQRLEEFLNENSDTVGVEGEE